MGDAYRPHQGYQRPRDDYARKDYDRGDYRRDDRYDRYDGRVDHHDARIGGGYNFRGAADRDQHYRPQEEFTFRAPGPQPQFPPADRNIPVPPRRSRNRHDESSRKPGGMRPIDQARQRHAQSRRGRGGFRSRAAHTRDILRATGRETTPEQLEGMDVGDQARFREVDSSSESNDDGEGADLNSDSIEDGEIPRKRTKLEAAPLEPAAPKWSNPDPYTVLPPPETLGAPKKDIVKVIRKAKVDADAKNAAKNAVSENADFISFNFDDDMDDSGMSDSSEPAVNHAPPDAPKGPSAFSHRTDFHPKIPSAQAPAVAFKAINDTPPTAARMADSGPPAPPPGLIMPTQDEVVARYLGESKGNKRKRGGGEAKLLGDIVDEWESNDSESTPWCKVDHSKAHLGLRLHQEICDFFEFVRPYDFEETARQELIDRINQATRTSSAKGARNVDLQSFGSFAAGLYLPTADMDLVAVSQGYMKGGQPTFAQTGSQMYKLKAHFENSGVAGPGGVAVIRAKVPIIKFTDRKTGIKVDMSFENDSGIVANRTFQQWKAQFPAMPVIVVLIKQLLAMRNLNEVFSGGIGGFTIICLVVSMMQMMPELQSGDMSPEMHYGELLMTFLDLYGNKFDMLSTGIRMNPPGYFDKVNHPAPKQNDDRLTIIDPNNPNNDISGGSREINSVLNCFRAAHAALQRRLSQVHAGHNALDSILGCMWGGNYTSFIRQRQKLSSLYRGYAASPPLPPSPGPVQSNGAHRGGSSKRPDPHGKAHAHPLPQRPAAVMHPLPPKPSSQVPPLAAQNGSATRATRPKPTKAAKTEKTLRAQKEDKAQWFKETYPHIPNVPDRLTMPELKNLCAAHGIPRPSKDIKFAAKPAKLSRKKTKAKREKKGP